MEFADDSTIVISTDDEKPCREEVRALAGWCSNSHLNLNTRKTKEAIIDFRKTRTTLCSGLSINGIEVEQVRNFKFLVLHITEDLDWNVSTTHMIKKAQQHLFFPVNAGGGTNSLHFCSKTLTVQESLLTCRCTVWYASSTASEKKQLQ